MRGADLAVLEGSEGIIERAGDSSVGVCIASAPHGIRQSGFFLVKGKKYTGHIWLRATPGV